MLQSLRDCESCQKITASVTPESPHSTYSHHTLDRRPPASTASRWLSSLILRSCLRRELSPEAEVAALRAPEAMKEQREKNSRAGKKEKTPRKTKQKASGHSVPCCYSSGFPAGSRMLRLTSHLIYFQGNKVHMSLKVSWHNSWTLTGALKVLYVRADHLLIFILRTSNPGVTPESQLTANCVLFIRPWLERLLAQLAVRLARPPMDSWLCLHQEHRSFFLRRDCWRGATPAASQRHGQTEDHLDSLKRETSIQNTFGCMFLSDK